MTSVPTEALREFLLAFADDEHLMGQQHTEWIGVAPFLEEDLALASIGQDELGHAVMLYELVCELDGVEPTDEAIDALAYGRGANEYRSCRLVEFATVDWAEALARHWIYDMVEGRRWSFLEGSSYQPLADAAVRASREESYHRRHAEALIDGLLADPTAQQRLAAAFASLMPMIGGLCASGPWEAEIVEAGIASAPTAAIVPELSRFITERFGVVLPGGFMDKPDPQTKNDRTQRSEDFAPLMARMREVLDLDLTATW